jgi:hypothetical protein
MYPWILKTAEPCLSNENPPHTIKADQLSQNFFTIDDMKFVESNENNS